MSWHQLLKIKLQKYKEVIQPYKLYITIVLGLFFWIIFSSTPAFFLTLLLIWFFYELKSKWITISVLVNILLIPIALLLEWEGLAEELAVFVYYLLIFTVLVELKNYFIGERKKVNIKNFIYVKNKSISVEQKLLKTDSFGGVWIKKSWSFANKYFLEIINYISRVRVSKFFIWYGVVGLINLIIPLLVFNFRGLPYFRDLVSLPYFHNLNSLRLDLEFVENSLFNSLVRSRFDPVFLSEGYFILWFFLGGLISFVFLKKIQASFNRTHQQEFFRVRNEVTLLIISLVYVYNPFIFERFLMGQHYVLRGHFVFMIALYYLLEFFKYFFNPHPISSKIHEDYIGYKESITNRVLSLFSGQEGSTEYFDRFVKLGLSFIFLALISTHHIIFAYYLIIISTLFYLFSKAIHYQKQKPNWRILLRSSVVLLMVILPSLLILVNRFSGESQLLQISNKNTSQGNSSIKRDIIKSFSLRTIDGQNLAIQGVLGAGSWDSRSFVETLEIESKLGFLSSLSTYYNPMIGFLFVFLFGVVTLSLLYQSDKNFKPLLYPFLLMIPISLVLTFGYSSGMEFINSWFHTLPSSYSLREGGKFYSLFLALISLLFVVYSKYLKTTTKYLAYGTFALYLVSNLLLFWHLGTSIRYVDIENGDYASVFDYVEQKCSLNKKVLYLPFDGYTDSSFSDVYIVNPTKHAIECNVLFPNRSTLVNFEQHNSVLNLEMSQTDQQIDRIVNGFETTSNIDNAFNVFDAQIKSLEVNILIVDEEKYPNLKEFNKKLSQKVAPELVKDQVFVYIFDWV